MTLYSFEGVRPYVHPEGFVHESAVLIGDVSVASGAYVGPHASLRGDFGRVVLEHGSNVQDCCVLHCFPGSDVTVAADGHVGHGAVLHGCTVGPDALIGIHAVLLDRAVIGNGAFVGANSLVRGNLVVPAGHLAMGSPATVVRALTEDEIAWKKNGTSIYHELALRSRATVAAVDEPDPVPPTGPRLPEWAAAVPIEEFRERAGRHDQRASSAGWRDQS